MPIKLKSLDDLKKNNSGRTKEEQDRQKSQEQNAAAKQKKTTSKKTSSAKSEKKTTKKKQEEEKNIDRISRNRGSQGAASRDVYDQNVRDRYGLRLTTAYERMAAENRPFAERFAEDTRKTITLPKANTPQREKGLVLPRADRYNPLIKTPTRMTEDTSPEINNLAEAVLRKGMQGVESALVGYSDRQNMKKAEDLLTGEYNNRYVPGVKGGLRMKVDDPAQVAKAEAEAKKAGFDSVEKWEIAQANELVHKNDDFYRRKEALDEDVASQGYKGPVKYLPDIAEVIGSMVPTMAVGAATGGIGGMLGLTGRTALAFNNLMTGGEISGRVSGQEARQVYDALVQQNQGNMTREQYVDAIKKANTAGELVGIAEAGTEALFGGIAFLGKGLIDQAAVKTGWELLSDTTKASIQAWRNTTAGRISTAVAQRLGGAMGEGMEEAIMTLAQPAIEESVAGLETDVTLSDIIKDFGMGAAVSLVLGVPVSVTDTAATALDANAESKAKKEYIDTVATRADELVQVGAMTKDSADQIVNQLKDVFSGRGSITAAEQKAEEKISGDALETVYDSYEEARDVMVKEAQTKADGEKIAVNYIKDGKVQTMITTAQNGRLGLGRVSEAPAEYQKIATAANATERSGYQLNVKEDIIREASALSKALGKEIEFVSKANAVHGYEQGGRIYVNANSTQSPTAAVIAHEMTHLLENTSSYKTLQDMAYRFYKNSVADKRAEIIANYEAAGVTLDQTKKNGYDEVDTEVMAMFVEEKLLTDYDSIQQAVKTDRTLAEKIVDWINKLIQKITGTKEQRFLVNARDMWARALQEEQGNKNAPKDGAEKRYSISENLKEDLEKVKNGTFQSKRNEVYIGETSKFLEEVIGVKPLSVTMPATKAYSSMVTEAEAKKDGKYKRKTNYHGLNVDGLFDILVESENPLMAFAAKEDEDGKDRSDRIVLVTDKKVNSGLGIAVTEVSSDAFVQGKIVEVNKTITVYDREQISMDISSAMIDGRLLYVDKKRSQDLAGVLGSNYQGALQGIDFNKNIQQFWDNVNKKRGKIVSQAPKKGKERFSIGRSELKVNGEMLSDGIAHVAHMEPVARITGKEFPKIGEQKINEKILKYMGKHHLFNSEVGEITFNNRSIKNDLAHGVGREKIASYIAVPSVLKEGKMVVYRENWKNRGYDTVTIAAPILINDTPYFEGIILKRDQNGNRFYLHEVWMEEDKKTEQHRSEPGGSVAVDSGDAVLSMNSILQRIIDVKYGRREAADVARDFLTANENEVRYSIGRPMNEKTLQQAKSYFVGDTVVYQEERGTIVERRAPADGAVSYTIELDNGNRIEISPEDLTVGVTPSLHFDELPKEDQTAWHEPPEDWNMGKGIEDVASIPVKVKGFVEILYQNGITVGSKKLFKWFRDNGYLGNIKGKNWNKPTQKSIDDGIFEVREYIHTKNDGKEEKKYTPLITEKGQRYFLDLFLNRNNNEFLDLDDRHSGIVLPGNEWNENKSPLEHAEMRAMLEEYGDDITDTGEDYSWAQALTGRGVTYSKDYARNFDAASKYNPNLRKHLQRIFVQPLEKGKADYAKAVRVKLEKMHEEMQKLGIKKDTMESAAVQWIGEGQYQDKYGEIHKYTPEMLREEFPDSYKKIEQAAAYFRRMYDDYLNEINAAREKIYPDPLGYAQNKLAYNEFMYNQETERIEKLRGAISEIENVLSVKKDEYTQAKNEEKRAELTRAIRYNEERLTKNANMLTETVTRKNKYESMIKSIRSDIENGDVLRNKRILPRKDYFHHFREMTDSLGDVFRISRNTTEIDPKMEGTSADTEPRSKFSGITLHRKNGRYTADAIGGMIDYAQAGEYMIHIDPVIYEFRNHIKGMAEATKDSRNANKLIRWLVQWTNDLAGKTNPADRFLQDVIGREAVQFARKINSRAKANAVVGNLNSATAQIFNLPNLVAHVTDPKAYVEGFADLCKFIARKQPERELVKQSGFLNERYLDDVIESFDERKIKIPEKVASWTLTVGDRYSTALIWFTAHHEAVNKGIVNPIEYADDITRRCVAGRGIGEIPITQKSNITQIFAPFQIEVNNAWQLYKEKLGGLKTKNTKSEKAISFMQFLSILIVNFMLNTITDLSIHRRVAFDPIYILFQCVADWMNEDEDEKTNWAERFVEVLGRESGEIISNMPYGSLIAYYAFNNQWARENLFGDQDPTRFGVGNTALEWVVGFVDSLATGSDIVDDAVGFLTTFVMPFGGKQAERTLQGLVDTGYLPQVKLGWKEGLTFGRVAAPGSYNKSGQFQFPLDTIKTDFGQWVTNVLFGKYATDEGQKYLGKDYEGHTWIQNILGFNKTKERSALSERATTVLTDLAKSGADVFEAYDTIRAIQDAEDTYAKRNVLLQSDLDSEEKTSILLGYLTQSNYMESTKEKLDGIIAAGLTVDDYLSLANTKYIIDKDEAYETAQDKAWAFNNAMIADGYTTEQIKGISEVLKFWSHIPADTTKFDKLTDAGLDSETSMKVTEALGALEPLPGASSISTLQKVEAIAGLNLSAEQETAALSAAMNEKQYAKYTSMTDYGVTAQVYADFEKALAAADAANNNNGSYDKDEKQAALDSLPYSNETKAVLWQSKDNKLGSKDKDTAWKAARNPYSASAATGMIDAYMEKLAAMESPEDGDSISSPMTRALSSSDISSEYGMRVHPISGKYKMHTGVDIPGEYGEEVIAVANAEVVFSGNASDGYGNKVVLQLSDGRQILYAHLKSCGVQKGDTVTKGQQVGEINSTGSSTGNHLHLEVRDASGAHVDPQSVIDLTGEGLKTSTEYTPYVSGGSSGGGGSSSGGSRGGGSRSGGSRVASVASSRSGSSAGTTGSRRLVLPKAGQSSAPVTGRSTKAPTYATKGLTLPKAGQRETTIAYNKTGKSTTSTQRTGRSSGTSFWDENILKS